MPNESPYEILDVKPDVSLAQLKADYQRALRQRRYPTAKIAWAYGELRNPQRRALHHLLWPDLAAETSEQDTIAELAAMPIEAANAPDLLAAAIARAQLLRPDDAPIALAESPLAIVGPAAGAFPIGPQPAEPE